MLDPWVNTLVSKPLSWVAVVMEKIGVKKDALTMAGFAIGMSAIVFIYFHLYTFALILIIVNRIFDGLDGALARKTTPTDCGGFLDITLDFIFYSGIVFGFALSDPSKNALAACFLIFSFIGTGSSFLAFSAMAEKNGIKSVQYINKSLYYLGGLMEGTETIIFFVLFCLFPDWFVYIAVVFSILCWVTTCFRVYSGYNTLKTIGH